MNHKSYIKRQKEEYYKNPKRCRYCGKIIPFERRLRFDFCDNSCSASYNNKLRMPRTIESRNKTSSSVKNSRHNTKIVKLKTG